MKISIYFHHLYSYLLFHNNNNKLANEAQEKARSNAMPQRYKGECYEVRDELISQKSKSFVQIPERKTHFISWDNGNSFLFPSFQSYTPRTYRPTWIITYQRPLIAGKA